MKLVCGQVERGMEINREREKDQGWKEKERRRGEATASIHRWPNGMIPLKT